MTARELLQNLLDAYAFRDPDMKKQVQQALAQLDAEQEEKDIIIRDLAMLIRRLCSGEGCNGKAMDYLNRKNLLGSILRAQALAGKTED
jgi:hypothetical protein